jgi:uncharacterized protein YecT (DUF1311 family)
MHADVARRRVLLARLLLVTVILTGSSPAKAEDAALARCLDSATGSEQKQCTHELFRQASDELKTTYAGVLQKADVRSSAAIAESQRAWEIYRDAECKGVVGRGDGSGRMVLVFGCLAEKARDRIRELNVPFFQR